MFFSLVGNYLHPSNNSRLLNFYINAVVLVFPPAPKKGMVKFPGKGHFKRAKTGSKGTFGTRGDRLEGTFQSKFLIEFDIVIYKNLCPLA